MTELELAPIEVSEAQTTKRAKIAKQEAKGMIKNRIDPRCRLCANKSETMDHLVAGCPIIAPKE